MPRDPREVEYEDRTRYVHMLKAADELTGFCKGRTRADLDTDRMFARAVMSCIQEIGEAASKITPEGRERASSLPWKDIIGTRQILVHAYFRVNADILWSVVIDHVPAVIGTIRPLLESWPEPPDI